MPGPRPSGGQGCLQEWLGARGVLRQPACWWGWGCVPAWLVTYPEASQYWCLQAAGLGRAGLGPEADKL